MTRYWRSLGFVPFALFLVLLVHDLSVKNGMVPNDQVGGNSVLSSSTASKTPRHAERLLAGSVTEIPLYESGDLPARQPAKKKVVKRLSVKNIKPMPAKQTEPPEPVPKMAVATSPPPAGSITGSEGASRPVLVASYDQIGFGRYLEVIESVGRFFILLKSDGSTKIGPPVSLAHRFTLPHREGATAGLAIERPHLVRDRAVRRRLREMRLPENAYADRVALLLRVGFDRALWFAVSNALRQKSLALRHVEEVSGHYVLRSGIIYLKFDGALLKAGQGYVPLKDMIRVKL
jgi:hypothetical protein